MAREKVRIFIGSGEQSLLERKVLIYSLRKHTKRDLDLYVFNGTHNAIERNDETPIPAPLPLNLKYQNITEFSLYRYLIPELCSFEGKAVYLDSDMVALADIGELFDASMNGYGFLVKSQTRLGKGAEYARSSVMLMDCKRCRFDLGRIYSEIKQGLYSYDEFVRFGKKFLARHSYRIGALDPRWNVFDRADSNTKLIHYTDLSTQPWKYRNHPYGKIWFSYFREAREAGWITDNDINLTVARGYVRPDLCGRNSRQPAGALKAFLDRWRNKVTQ